MRALDGGQLDAPELPLSTAALKICEMHGMGGQSIRYAPLSMIETLQEAAVQQMQAAAQAAVPEVTQLPDAPEQTLDEYPMPEPGTDPGRSGEMRLSGPETFCPSPKSGPTS